MEERNNTHFTPGPWNTYVHGEEFECIGVKDKYGQSICECFTASRWGKKGLPGISGDEQEANAHLIATAPEMYEWQEEVLEILRRLCRSLNTDDYIRERLEPVIYRGEQIGKKARGEE